MSNDPFYDALIKQYGKIYNPEANDMALEKKRAVEERRAKLQALFPAQKPPPVV